MFARESDLRRIPEVRADLDNPQITQQAQLQPLQVNFLKSLTMDVARPNG